MAFGPNASYFERLPVETWSYIFRTLLGSIEDRNERARFVICEDHIQIAQRPFNKFRQCLSVCKRWKDIALPIMYEDIRIQSSHQLQRLAAALSNDPSHTAASWIRSISVPALLDSVQDDEIMQEYITLYNELHLIFHVVSRLESVTIQANMQTSILVSFSRSSPTTLRYMDIIVHNLSDIKPLTYLRALTELIAYRM